MKLYSLDGAWEAASEDGKYAWEARVPGSILEGLEGLGALGQGGLFRKENADAAVDLMRRAFVLSRGFDLPRGFLLGEDARAYLEAEGLDTLAAVSLNGRTVGTTKNMHRSYRFDVTDLLEPTGNLLSVRFADSLAHIAREHERRPLSSEDEAEAMTVKGFYHIRKSHCSYGWDWGPKAPDAGIWRPIRLAAYEAAGSTRSASSRTTAPKASTCASPAKPTSGAAEISASPGRSSAPTAPRSPSPPSRGKRRASGSGSRASGGPGAWATSPCTGSWAGSRGPGARCTSARRRSGSGC